MNWDFNLRLVKTMIVMTLPNLLTLCSNFPHCLTKKPNRVADTTASVIDHTWTTEVESNINNFIIHLDITDHFPIMLQFKLKTNDPCANISQYIHKRIINNKCINNFNNDLQLIVWSEVKCSTCPNESYNIFHGILHKHFPTLKILINKKKKKTREVHILPGP